MFFREEYDFLSNMYPCKVELCFVDTTYTFSCAEAAFQACKDISRISEFVGISGQEAKKLGRKVQLNPNWDKKRIEYMKYILKAKFDQNIFLRTRLSNIEAPITEENNWNDTFWGVCNGVGENHLGLLLTDLRDQYNPFYCLVVGSRNFDDFPCMCKILDHLLQNKKYVVIVSGGAKGADSYAEKYADDRGYPTKVFPADWDRYGKSAGYKRNETMHLWISARKQRGVVAFWDENSKGTQHNFQLCKDYNNPLKVYSSINNRFLTRKEIYKQ